jgi:hypothetical protein
VEGQWIVFVFFVFVRLLSESCSSPLTSPPHKATDGQARAEYEKMHVCWECVLRATLCTRIIFKKFTQMQAEDAERYKREKAAFDAEQVFVLVLPNSALRIFSKNTKNNQNIVVLCNRDGLCFQC